MSYPNFLRVEEITRDYTTEWLDLTSIKEQLNLWGDDSQDDLLAKFELAARNFIEDYLGGGIFARTYQAYYKVQADKRYYLPKDYPVILAVQYYDQNNALQNITVGNYVFDPSTKSVLLSSGLSGSSFSQSIIAPVLIAYNVAPRNNIANPVVKLAGEMLVTHWYSNRSAVEEKKQSEIPLGFYRMLSPYKPLTM